MTLPEAFRSVRAAHNLSQEGLARRLNLSLRSIARYEAGEGVPSPQTLRALIAMASGITHLEERREFQKALSEQQDREPLPFFSYVQGEQTGAPDIIQTITALRKAVRESRKFNNENLTLEEAMEAGQTIRQLLEDNFKGWYDE